MKFYYFTESKTTQKFCTADGKPIAIDRGKQWQKVRKEREMEKNRSVKWSDSADAGTRDEIVYLCGWEKQKKWWRNKRTACKQSSMQRERFIIIYIKLKVKKSIHASILSLSKYLHGGHVVQGVVELLGDGFEPEFLRIQLIYTSQSGNGAKDYGWWEWWVQKQADKQTDKTSGNGEK